MADPKQDVDDAEKTSEEYVEKVAPQRRPDDGSGGNSPAPPRPPSVPPKP